MVSSGDDERPAARANGFSPPPISATNSNGCAAPLRGLPSAANVSRSPPKASSTTEARRGRRHAVITDEAPAELHAAMTRAQRLKRVFKIDIETCETCGGKMKVIASIEDPAVIKRILAHLDNRQGVGQHLEHPPWAPPQLMLRGLLD